MRIDRLSETGTLALETVRVVVPRFGPGLGAALLCTEIKAAASIQFA